MILKYRKAFYDYIYKSKTQAINSFMWDEIMWNSIIGDLRSDKITDKGYHSKEYSIKEKLNIWFSLCNYFVNDKKEDDMASKIPELLEKMKEVANNDNEHFKTTEEFAFGAGQVIYFLLKQSKASDRTHALLEPFIQKVKALQLQNSIAQTINTYKHEISFGQGRFERLSAEVLGFETDENLKNHQRLLLAGYFATPVIYEKKENKDKKGE
jgi:CRISPR-associated protein Csh1